MYDIIKSQRIAVASDFWSVTLDLGGLFGDCNVPFSSLRRGEQRTSAASIDRIARSESGPYGLDTFDGKAIRLIPDWHELIDTKDVSLVRIKRIMVRGLCHHDRFVLPRISSLLSIRISHFVIRLIDSVLCLTNYPANSFTTESQWLSLHFP